MNIEYERLKIVATKYFGNLSKMSELLGKKRQFFHAYKDKTGIGRSVLSELQHNLKINPRYIQYGEEPMLLSEQKVESNVEEVGTATLTLLPDIRSLTPDQMKQILQWSKNNIPKIEKILETIDN